MQILIVDLGSQYTQVIGRRLRELGYLSIVLNSESADQWLQYNRPKAIILSGSYASVTDENPVSPPQCIFQLGIPVLGICYGMQWYVSQCKGSIIQHHSKNEYGKATFRITKHDVLFEYVSEQSTVWASHGDSVGRLPDGFEVIGVTKPNMVISAIKGENFYGLQFHPEVVETDEGTTILKNFVQKVCECKRDWEQDNIISTIIEQIAYQVGDNTCVLAYSGGVDSTVIGCIAKQVLGNRLKVITLDTGGLRLNEVDEIKVNAAVGGFLDNVTIEECSSLFVKQIGLVMGAESKRKLFANGYKAVIRSFIQTHNAKVIMQGTLATDLIESGQAGQAAVIKSHHNVRNNWNLKEVVPLSNLFKHEVRDIAAALGLPDNIVNRHPFPGPGLYTRIVGLPVDEESVEVVRWADNQVTMILKEYNVYNNVSQVIVGLLGTPTVGIKGDGRAYGPSVVVRAVITTDFMTAKGFQFPENIRELITSTLTKHPGIVRVFYDETNKPPATIELE